MLDVLQFLLDTGKKPAARTDEEGTPTTCGGPQTSGSPHRALCGGLRHRGDCGGTELALLTWSRVALAVLLLGGFSLLGMAGVVRGDQHTKRPRWAGWAGWAGWAVMGATLGVPLSLAFMPLPIGGAV